MSKSGAAWSSWHLHTHAAGQEALDRIVIGVVGPAAALLRTRQPQRPWFFMRYWQAGPHVRLRVGGADEALGSRLRDLLAERLSSVNAGLADRPQIDAASYRAGAVTLAAAGEGGDELEVHDLLPAGVHDAHYEPELERYGGAALIEISEHLFGSSSRLALTVLERGLAREAFALEAVAAAGAALGDRVRRERFARGTRDFWLEWGRRATRDGPQVDLIGLLATARALVDRIEQAKLADRIVETENAPIRRWHEELEEAVSHWPQPELVLASHTHMLLNRLGLGPSQEVLVHAALSELLGRRRTGQSAPLPTARRSPPAVRDPRPNDLVEQVTNQVALRCDDPNDLHVLPAGARAAVLVGPDRPRGLRSVAGDALEAALESSGGGPAQALAVLSGPRDAPLRDPWTAGMLRTHSRPVRDPELAALALGLDGMDRVVHQVWELAR